MHRVACAIVLCLAMGIAGPGEAGQAAPFTFDGPPAPIAPAVINRDEAGRATIRAIRLDEPLRIDGALDEAVYRTVPPVSGFIQIEPRAGELATNGTDVWLSFDNDNVYVSIRAWDPRMDTLIATEMRRDGNVIYSGDDVVGILFDTFYDRRNSFTFYINPLGGRQDGQVANERQFSADWNPIWEVKTGRFDGGWTIETAIPFKSLRYRSGRAQLWGFNIMRVKRASNEISYITRMPPARGQQTMQQASLAATVVGIEAPEGSRNFDLKPYVSSSATSDINAVPRLANDLKANFGLDAKYGLTQGLSLDVTYNTDFAQVEADEQQVNLTRFSLFFPEKREFFLENQGMFGFGGVAVGGNAGGNTDAPTLFYSRRIGLSQGREVPLDVGGRVTGRVGRYSLGLVNIQTGNEPVAHARSTNFSVVRVKRDLLRRSAVGMLVTGRSVAQAGAGSSETYGVDGTFAFFDNLGINTYWARTRTGGLRGDDTSYRAQLDYTGDRYGVQIDRLAIGDNFNPEVGFVRRDDMRRTYGQFRFSPRPRAGSPLSRRVRRFSYQGWVSRVENGGGRLETRERTVEVAVEFQNADRVHLAYNNSFEFLVRPFSISQGVVLPVGGYPFGNVELGFNMGQQRRRAANMLLEHGTFYNGRRTAFTATRGRVRVANQLSLEPTYSINRVRLTEGDFTSHLAGSRITYSMTPLMFTSALVQYNSGTHSISANVRLRWEYRPGSELFIVYNEDRNTRTRSFPDLSTRALIVKVNRLFRF